MTKNIDELISTHIQLWQIFSKKSKVSLEEKTATMLQYHVLRYIHQNQLTTIGNFAEALRLSFSSATQLIDRLTKTHYITKVVDKEDKRITHLNLSKQGENELVKLQHAIKEKMEHLFSQISEEDIAHLSRINKNLLQKLNEEL